MGFFPSKYQAMRYAHRKALQQWKRDTGYYSARPGGNDEQRKPKTKDEFIGGITVLGLFAALFVIGVILHVTWLWAIPLFLFLFVLCTSFPKAIIPLILLALFAVLLYITN